MCISEIAQKAETNLVKYLVGIYYLRLLVFELPKPKEQY